MRFCAQPHLQGLQDVTENYLSLQVSCYSSTSLAIDEANFQNMWTHIVDDMRNEDGIPIRKVMTFKDETNRFINK